MSFCVSCHGETNKYKCTKCVEPYCSLVCFKEHTKVACEPKSENAAERTCTVEQEPTLHDPFATEDTVSREKLEKLRHSEGLHHLLYNPHLRNLLREIDVAPSAWKAIRAAMQEPLFIEFADECLKLVDPMSAEEQHEQLLMK